MKKNKQEFNLSKKLRNYDGRFEKGAEFIVFKEDIKEFIKKLKERIKQEKIPKQIIKSKYYTGYIKHNKQVDDLINDIDKLAGDKLI